MEYHRITYIHLYVVDVRGLNQGSISHIWVVHILDWTVVLGYIFFLKSSDLCRASNIWKALIMVYVLSRANAMANQAVLSQLFWSKYTYQQNKDGCPCVVKPSWRMPKQVNWCTTQYHKLVWYLQNKSGDFLWFPFNLRNSPVRKTKQSPWKGAGHQMHGDKEDADLSWVKLSGTPSSQCHQKFQNSLKIWFSLLFAVSQLWHFACLAFRLQY